MASQDGVFQGAKITTKLALGGVFYHKTSTLIFEHFWGVQKHPFLVFFGMRKHTQK
jgi:hypothetical protein